MTLPLISIDTVLCCSVILSEWMFDLAADLNAAKYGELLSLIFYALHNGHVRCS